MWFKNKIHIGLMTTPWLDIAMNELGISEVYGADHNPRIIEYHEATDLGAQTDETAWCASFVSWCLEKAGYKSTRSAWAKDYLNWGEAVDDPYPGCIAVFHRGWRNQYGHVGFYVGTEGSKIRILGGNQSNKVSIKSYSTSKLIGYRHPRED